MVVLDLLETLLISLVMAAVRRGDLYLREASSRTRWWRGERGGCAPGGPRGGGRLAVLWTVAVVVAVLAFAQQAHNRQRRRSDSASSSSAASTGALGDQLNGRRWASSPRWTWMTHQLRAEAGGVAQPPLGFAGEERGWRSAYDGTVTEGAGPGRGSSTEQPAAGPGSWSSAPSVAACRSGCATRACATRWPWTPSAYGINRNLVVGQRLSWWRRSSAATSTQMLAPPETTWSRDASQRAPRRPDPRARAGGSCSVCSSTTSWKKHTGAPWSNRNVAALLVDGHDGATPSSSSTSTGSPT